MVRNALRAVRLARAGEAFLLGLGGFLLALSAAVRSGGELGESASIVAALLTGAALAGAWLAERWPEQARIARKVDARLGLDGALFTAFENGNAREPTPLARLLDARVLARVQPRRIMHAALPNSAPFLAVPFLAFAVFGWCVGERETPPDPLGQVAPLAGDLARELSLAVDAGLEAVQTGEFGQADLQSLMALEQAARDLARQASTQGLTADELDATFSGVMDDVRAAARDLPAVPEVTSALTRADALGEAARMGLEEALAHGRDEAGDGAHGHFGSEGDPAGGRGAAIAAAGDGASGSAGDVADGERGKLTPGLTNDDPHGTIPDRSPTVTVPEDGGTAFPGEAGVTTGRWWPDHHAGVVGRWVEARRAAFEAAVDQSSPPSAGD